MKTRKKLKREIKDLNDIIDGQHTKTYHLEGRINNLEYLNKTHKLIVEGLTKISREIKGISKHNISLQNQKECKHDPKNFKVFQCESEIRVYCGDCDKAMKDYDVIFKSK